MTVALEPAGRVPDWYRPPAEREPRLRWLADQVMFLADEWREAWEADPKAGTVRCPIHLRPHLGDCVDIDAGAVCPLCAVAARVRKLKRYQARIEVVR